MVSSLHKEPSKHTATIIENSISSDGTKGKDETSVISDKTFEMINNTNNKEDTITQGV